MQLKKTILSIIAVTILATSCSQNPKTVPTLAMTVTTVPTPDAVVPPTPIPTATEEAIDLSKYDLTPAEKTDIEDAYNKGIAWKDLLKKLDQEISLNDALTLLKNADALFFGESKSNYFKEYPVSENEAATRMEIAELIFYRKMERLYNVDSFFPDPPGKMGELWNSSQVASYNTFPYAGLIGKKADGSYGEMDLWRDCADLDVIDQHGSSSAVNYVLRDYSRKSGAKLMSLNEENKFDPEGSLTAKDAILIAYNYYDSIEPDPKYVSLADAGTYDKNIITDELIQQASTLPDGSNTGLPAWKGFSLNYMSNTAYQALSSTADDWVTESEIKAIASTGANFLRIWTSLSRFEGPAYANNGTVNLYYLEHLDEIIAWGMKYGVHIQISVTDGPGMDPNVGMDAAREKTNSIFTDPEYADLLRQWWQMLAHRYASIPNKNLSFNFLNEPNPPSESAYAAVFGPIAEAIWKESPDRIIIADIHGDHVTGEKVAGLGIALSAHLYEPNGFCIVNEDQEKKVPGFYENLTWPYLSNGQKIDAAASFTLKHGMVSLNDVKTTADKNGVGFMVGEFGIFEAKGGTMFEFGIPRSVVTTMLQDTITTMDSMGIPWAANWVENYGVASSYPINKEAKYQKLDGTSYYVDTVMLDFFKKVIGVR